MKKVTVAMMTILSLAFFVLFVLLKFMQGDNVREREIRRGRGRGLHHGMMSRDS